MACSMTHSVTEDDVSVAYERLWELVNDTSCRLEAHLAEVELHSRVLIDQIWQPDEDALSLDGLEKRADGALRGGLVDLFEKVACHCDLWGITKKEEVGVWVQAYDWLRNVLQYRGAHSPRLAKRLASSRLYFRSVELYLRWNIDSEQNEASVLKNLVILCDTAPIAIGADRSLYQLVLEIYQTKK